MNLIIAQNLQLALLEYLMKQPYQQVAGLIQQMQRLQPAPSQGAEIPSAPPGKNGKEAEDTEKKTAEA